MNNVARPRSGSEAPSGWAFFIPWDPRTPGGVSQVVLRLSAAMRRDGRYVPIVVVQDWGSREPRVEDRDGVQYVFARWREPPREGDGLSRRISYHLRNRVELQRIASILRDRNVAVINFHYPALGAKEIVRTVRRHQSVTTIMSLHGLDLRSALSAGNKYAVRFRAMVGLGDRVVAVSNAFREEIVVAFPELANRVEVIHNGIDPKAYEASVHTDNTQTSRRYILHVGTFEEKKGQLVLLDAFAGVRTQHPELDLVLIGRSTPHLAIIESRIAQLGLQQCVHVLPDLTHEEVLPHYRHATLFCLSSLYEPFGIVILEAGMYGLPVVASRVGGVPEIIRDGEDGLLVEPGHPELLMGALNRMLADERRRAEMGQSLRAHVKGGFTWASACESYLGIARKSGPNEAP